MHIPAGDQHQPRHTGLAGQLGPAGDGQIKSKDRKKGIKANDWKNTRFDIKRLAKKTKKRLENDKQSRTS